MMFHPLGTEAAASIYLRERRRARWRALSEAARRAALLLASVLVWW